MDTSSRADAAEAFFSACASARSTRDHFFIADGLLARNVQRTTKLDTLMLVERSFVGNSSGLQYDEMIDTIRTVIASIACMRPVRLIQR